jgi:outer membrane lipoprotein-sorting protein
MRKASATLLALSLFLLFVLGCKYSGSIGSNTSNNSDSKTTTTNTRSSNTTTSSDERSQDQSDDSGNGVSVDSITLAKDDGSGDDGEEVNTFEPSDNPQHFVVDLSEAKSGTKVKAEWYIVNAGGEKNQKFLELEKETRGLENKVDFTATLKQPWPTGDYRIDILINGRKATSMNYKVVQ